MNFIIKIAWRNIWRNKRRSLILMATIAVGIFGYLGTTSFMKGFNYQMIESSINLYNGHIQIAEEGYHKNPVIRTFLKAPELLEGKLREIEGVHYAPFVQFQGMISSSETASGVQVNGIHPQKQKDVTVISEIVVEGHYLEPNLEDRSILLGEALAERLNVRLGEKVVLMVNSLTNEISSEAFRVTGIFRSTSPEFDKTTVFIPLKNAQGMVGYTDAITGLGVRLKQGYELSEVEAKIATAFARADVEYLTWKERFPLLMITIQAFDAFSILFIVIVFTAIAFSIINTFLMVIFERIREIGIMMAIGIKPGLIRRLLMWETVFVTLIGTVAGTLFTAVSLGYLAVNGLDLSVIAQGLAKIGIGAVVHPVITMQDFVIGLVSILIVVIISTFFPARRASKYQIVDAINFE